MAGARACVAKAVAMQRQLLYTPFMAELAQITPCVMTHDTSATRAFFAKIIGFVCNFVAETYAFLHQPAGALRLFDLQPDCEIGERMIYLVTADVDALYAELKPALVQLPKDRVRAPFDQPYVQRELHVKHPDNRLISGADTTSIK